MKIAVASQNFRTVTQHAGKTRRFLVFEAGAGGAIEETGRLDLPLEQSMHEFRGGVHPLDVADVLIAGSAGEGFVRRMGERGISVVVTDIADPLAAIGAFLRGEIAPVRPSAAAHQHAHDHAHDHAHVCGH